MEKGRVFVLRLVNIMNSHKDWYERDRKELRDEK
jgi:hypothetical protein